eukprot:TRINITY_DN1389_c0_g3_i2.p1 TRINITY_DN1389_c0_g3~~TRINITY_DN1389_c0_g3_i2.p1  ORF type:complete len:227 (-),score=49.89 TRINITY_DN1389_c0_g3_i2:22-681(-)
MFRCSLLLNKNKTLFSLKNKYLITSYHISKYDKNNNIKKNNNNIIIPLISSGSFSSSFSSSYLLNMNKYNYHKGSINFNEGDNEKNNEKDIKKIMNEDENKIKKQKKWYDYIPGSIKDENITPNDFSWWWDRFIICVVFAITGSGSLFIVRPLMAEVLNLKGGIIEGPWSYRIAYFTIMMPAYSLTLITLGTIAGRHQFFKSVLIRMWSKLLPFLFKKK